MRRLLPIRRRRDRGAVIPMVALSLTVLMTMTAFAVDLGRMRTERRDLQADADALALDAVQMIRGLDAAAALSVAQAEAAASAVRNGVDPSEIQSVEVGTWDVPTQTFTAMTSGFPDAVRVILTDMVDMFFDFSTDERSVTRTGVAKASGGARGEIGSVLAGLQQTVDPVGAPCSVYQQVSFMNAIYTTLLGITTNVEITGDATVDTGDCEVSTPTTGLKLDALSWQGLGFGRVDLDDVATQMGLGSQDDLLNGSVNARDFLQASAAVLQASPEVLDAEAGTILGQIATAMSATNQVNIGDAIDAGTGNESSAADASVDALTILTSTAMLINGDNLAAVDVPLTLPYLNGPVVNTRLHIVEPPVSHLDHRMPGQPGPKTAQVRLAIEVPLKDLVLDFGVVGGLLSSLGVQTTTGNLKFVVEVGRAEATYDSIQCPVDGPTTVTMSVDTGAVTAAYGAATATQLTQSQTVDVSSSSQLHGSFGVSVPLLGTVGINLNQITNVEQTETFMTQLDALAAGGGDINLLGAEAPHTFDTFGADSSWHRYPGGISGTELSDFTYSQIQYNTALGSVLSTLGITQLGLTNLVRSSLDPVVDDLGVDVIEPLLSALGITVAGADGRILSVACQMPALANRG